MAVQKTQHYYTIEEYHQIEEAFPDRKFEYVNGQIRAMAGGKIRHSQIAVNLLLAIGNHLQDDAPCRVFNSDAHVCPTGTENPSYLPDVTVTCTPSDYEEDDSPIFHPRLIIEVLSKSTAHTDQHEKLQAYQACPSMEEYVIVSTKQQEVTVYRREAQGGWEKTIYTHGESIPLHTIRLTLPMKTFYRLTPLAQQVHQQ